VKHRRRRSIGLSFARAWMNLRQWRYPSAFWIPDPDREPEAVDPGPSTPPHAETAPGVAERRPDAELLVLLVETATHVWRVRRRTSQLDRESLPRELKQIHRHVEAAWDTFHAAGLEVRDHTNARYVAGMALRVLAFQPTEGVGVEVIQETLKPSIYFRDRLLQRGEVIVATPQAAEPTSTPPLDPPAAETSAGISPSAGSDPPPAPESDLNAPHRN
jgi:hypothetical protein